MPALRRPVAPTTATAQAWTVLGAGLLLAVVVAVARSPVVAGASIAVSSFAAMVAIVVGLRRFRPARPFAWHACLAALSTGVVAGSLGATLTQEGWGEVVTDGFYLLGYALFIVAALALVPPRGPERDWVGLLDGITVGTAGALAFWTVAVRPRLAGEVTFHTTVTGILYPLLDLVLLVVLVRLVTAGVRRSFAFVMVPTALGVSIATDFWYAAVVTTGHESWGSLADPFWVLPMTALGAGALHPSMVELGSAPPVDRPTITWPRLLFVEFGSVICPFVLVAVLQGTGHLGDYAAPLLIGSAVILAASLARVAELVRQVRARADELAVTAQRLQASLEDRQRLSDELLHSALHDPLTGLANRRMFDLHLKQALDRRHPTCAVLMVDLDDFKAVNDSLGHRVGDRVLVAMARRIESVLRPSDTPVRLGGDEFVVLLDDAVDAVAVAERVLLEITRPLELEDRLHDLRASIGVAAWTPGQTDLDLLRDADIAMYAAKHAGKNRVAVFTESMRLSLADRSQLELDLKRAIDREEIGVVYQPLVRLADDRIVGVEALARWQHGERGPISPADFIPMAESTGLIGVLGSSVLRRAVTQTRWCVELGSPFEVAVNVSPLQLQDPSFADEVAAAMALLADGQHLVVELTETAMMSEPGQIDVLARVRAAGCRIAMDDFGIGFSSLANLRRLPVDIVKIDRSFITDLDSDDEARSLVRAIVELSHSLQIDVVAEGIETPEVARIVHELGCIWGQGFYYSRPVPGDALSALLHADQVGRSV